MEAAKMCERARDHSRVLQKTRLEMAGEADWIWAAG